MRGIETNVLRNGVSMSVRWKRQQNAPRRIQLHAELFATVTSTDILYPFGVLPHNKVEAIHLFKKR
jgi:hypothetical protein